MTDKKTGNTNRNPVPLKKESGMVSVEALLFVGLFLFFFVCMINILNLIMAQTIIQYALNQSAKEVAEYSYILTKAGLVDNFQRNAAAGERMIGNTQEMFGAIEQFSSAVQSLSGNMTSEEAYRETYESGENMLDTGERYMDYLQNNWKEDGLGTLKNMVTNSAGSAAGTLLVQNRVKKHLDMLVPNGQADALLETIGVEGGSDGVNCDHSKFYGGETKDLFLTANYRIHYTVPFITIPPKEITLRAATGLW